MEDASTTFYYDYKDLLYEDYYYLTCSAYEVSVYIIIAPPLE